MQHFGWNEYFEQHRLEHHDPSLRPARIVAEHRGGYEHVSAAGTRLSPLTGALARAQAWDRPTVGDWVMIDEADRIRHVLMRRTWLARKAAGEAMRPQLVAANVDRVFVVTSPNRDLSARRVERYLAAIWDGGAEPVVVLNKVDLCADPGPFLLELPPDVTAIAVSAALGTGLDSLRALLEPGRTAAFVGSSGVGKSTLLNALLGEARQDTGPTRADDDRGRHTTTHRELVVLPGGGLVVDTPGMRELGLWLEGDGLDAAFADLQALAAGCRFHDCRHDREPGCAVQAAIAGGTLDPARLLSARKLEREQAYHLRQVDAAERRKEHRRVKLIHKEARRRDRLPRGER